MLRRLTSYNPFYFMASNFNVGDQNNNNNNKKKKVIIIHIIMSNSTCRGYSPSDCMRLIIIETARFPLPKCVHRPQYYRYCIFNNININVSSHKSTRSIWTVSLCKQPITIKTLYSTLNYIIYPITRNSSCISCINYNVL
jgi:hypothetical protein